MIDNRDLESNIVWAIIDNVTNELIGTSWIAPAISADKKIITEEGQWVAKKFGAQA